MKDFPALFHPELLALENILYELSEAEAEAIAGLPRETAIQDLEQIVRWGLEAAVTEPNVENSVLHAYLWLGHFRSEASLPLFFDALRLDEKPLEALFGDFLLEDFHVPLGLCALGRLDALADFAMEAAVPDQFARLAAVASLEGIFEYLPKRREAVLIEYERLLRWAAAMEKPESQTENMNILLGSLCESVLLTGERRVLPLAKPLFEKGLIEPQFFDDFEDFKKSFGERTTAERFWLDVRDWYRTFAPDWEDRVKRVAALEAAEDAGESAGEVSAISESLEKLGLPRIQIAHDEAGKSRPATNLKQLFHFGLCHCGSGKKYRKCHGA